MFDPSQSLDRHRSESAKFMLSVGDFRRNDDSPRDRRRKADIAFARLALRADQRRPGRRREYRRWLEAMMKTGVCSGVSDSPKDWQGRDWPSDWQAEAKKFRILEAFDCPTFEAAASARATLHAGRVRSLLGAGGHAITAVGLKKSGGGWYLEFLNSWGTGGATAVRLPAGIEMRGHQELRCFCHPQRHDRRR